MIAHLSRLVDEVGRKASILIRQGNPHPRASVLHRLPPPDISLTPEVRCAVVGNVDSGKSTILGMLTGTRGSLDDGGGLARVALFEHKHGIESGRTSSVGMEILIFDVAGASILPLSSGSVGPDVLRREKLGWEEISHRSAKIVTFIDCKNPVFVKSIEAAVEASQIYGFTWALRLQGLHSPLRICPIFQVSNVTGTGLDFVRTFLDLLPATPKGDPVLFGPDSNGLYAPTVVKTMQRKRADVTTAVAGQTVALVLKYVPRAAVRKAVRRFEGQVLILYHNTTMQPNYQAMLHCGAVRQTVRIVSIDYPQDLLRTGDRATVVFEFIAHPEFVKAGMKLLFREGKTKGLGVITRLSYARILHC
ncbi:hypothetical protein BJV78DRAFT_1278644 [Lactifluus subvellereus]|nr:hypothetical protein BJV78DRAFT_1278644 [Lactifluus subvellereus]